MMNENHYNSLITLGFVSVSLAFAYFTMRDTEPISISEENIKKEMPRDRGFSTLSSIALWLKILVGLQAFSLLRTFF